jgi:hypothetical protein
MVDYFSNAISSPVLLVSILSYLLPADVRSLVCCRAAHTSYYAANEEVFRNLWRTILPTTLPPLPPLSTYTLPTPTPTTTLTPPLPTSTLPPLAVRKVMAFNCLMLI